MDKARQRALLILMEVNEDSKYANISLKEHLDRKEFNDRDASFITQLVYGTLENQTTIDRVLKKFAKMKRVNPRIENILRMGAYQILYLDKVPDSAACNEAVKLCIGLGLKPLKGFVNGVLRNISRNKKDLNISKPLAKDA
ncbi:MAG TPA: transcription antitermination factor NusB, partial [Clostridia bacterium]|nr:transcription antitermination factor NusB [Clostridia bacterium]